MEDGLVGEFIKIVIRTDSSDWIGTGHTSRCLTLSNELAKKGADITFISRKMKNNINYFIKKNNYNLIEIDQKPLKNKNMSVDDYASKLGVTEEEDAKDTVKIIKNIKPNLIIIDHYSLSKRWESIIRPFVDKIMVIDDLANRIHDCDFFLDQNFHNNNSKRYQGLLPTYCTKFLGPKYSLLRPEFYRQRKKTKPNSNDIKKIFVYFGGSDPDGLTIKALKALSNEKLLFLKVDVVIGNNTFNENLIKKIVESRVNTNLHIQSENISKIMANADIAIGSGGVNTWERMSMGLPTLAISFAENHDIVLKSLSLNNFLIYLGKSSEVNEDTIFKKIIHLINDISLFKELKQKTRSLVNANGAQLISEYLTGDLTKKKWKIMLATISDCKLYLDWANDKFVRKNAFTKESITYKKHFNWFRKKLGNKKCIIYKVLVDNYPIGQVRFDIKSDIAFIDYSISRQFRGRKLGRKLLSEGLREFEKKYKYTLKGNVKTKNYASSNIFKSLGFSMKIVDDILVFTKRSQ